MFKKSLVGLMVVASLFVLTGTAMALQDPSGDKGNIVPNQNTKVTGPLNLNGNGNYKEYVQGIDVTTAYTDSFNISTHVQGTWNSPYTAGIDGYNYNDPQDYVADGDQNPANAYRFQSGPHGGYLTSTHRCRECHAVHRAAGKFKLLRSDTRFEACDWCHGTGAGSGFNIQMDNDDSYTQEYNVGHTMGFGMSSGKWKAPDDTYPAFTPNYWQGGFSCFDCHSPHANPARMLGYDDAGQVQGLAWASSQYYSGQTRYYSIINPGHGSATDFPGASIKCVDCHKKTLDGNGSFSTGYPSAVPLYQAGSWLLLKNADREIAVTSETVTYFKVGDAEGQAGTIETMDITIGQEISDMVFAYSELVGGEASVTAGQLHQFDTDTAYPVNKIPIDWNTPMGIAKLPEGNAAMTVRTYLATEPAPHTGVWNVNEFCTDCHDGNAGLHTVAAPLFSEDRALRNQGNNVDGTPINDFRGNYDIAYGHDQNSRHCGRQMQFNPEDVTTFGPHCRNCHRGSSSCGRCHSETSASLPAVRALYTSNLADAANNSFDRAPAYSIFGITVDKFPGIQGQSTFHEKKTSTGEANMIIDYNFTEEHGAPANAGFPNLSFMYKKSRTADWYDDWRTATGYVQMGKMMATGVEIGTNGVDCSDDGFSWPHRTLGWKMLKDDLFGLNFDGTPVNVGGVRTYGGTNYAVHDLDSVCLDCHNPTVWRATSAGDHTDDPATNSDNHDDELLTRGLP